MNAQMLAARNWLLHKNKRPFYVSGRPRSGKLDSPADRAKLATYDDAVAALDAAPKRYTGLGFAINDGWQFVDLDKCRDPVAGEPLDLDTAAFVNRAYEAGAYVEASISGTGYHILGHGKPGAFPTHKSKGFETYAHARYMALGGALVDGSNPLPCIVGLLPAWDTPAKAPGKAQATRKPGRAPLTWPEDRKHAQTLLPALNPDIDYPEWIEIGMALHDASGGDPEGLEIWETWSRGGDKFTRGACAKMWNGFKLGAGITMGTLVKMCRDASEQNAKWAEAEPTNGRRRRVSHAELMTTKHAPTTWAVDKLIAPGLTLLAAPPKAGKSYFVLQMALCVGAGLPFLGRPTRKQKVVYFNLEEWEEMLQPRVIDICNGNHIRDPDVDYIFELDKVDDQTFLDEAQREIDAGAGLIIIDILARVRDELKEDAKANAYARDYNALKHIADFILQRNPRVCVVMVHHTNKGNHDDWQNKISGSQGLAGATHTNIVMYGIDRRGLDSATKEKALDYRQLGVQGKLVPAQEMMLKKSPHGGGWMVTDETEEDIKTFGKHAEILQVLREGNGAWMSAKDVKEHVAGTLDSIKKMLVRMAHKGEIVSSGTGGAGYRLKPDA